MKQTKKVENRFTVAQMSERTGISKKSILCAVKRIGLPMEKSYGIRGYSFTEKQFQVVCNDDYIFEKMHNYKIRDYHVPPVIITYHIYESKMNRDE